MTPFWEKSLDQLTREEWEALCDGCGLCCLHKLEDDESGEVFYTAVACRLLDLTTCRCRHYRHRRRLVSDCLVLDAGDPAPLEWLPRSCAYRLRSAGKPLPRWHPLLTGNRESPRAAGVAACAFAVSEDRLRDPDDIQEYVIEWP